MVITDYVSNPKSVAEEAYEVHGGSTKYPEMVRNVLSLVPGLIIDEHIASGRWHGTHKFKVKDVKTDEVYDLSLVYGSCRRCDTLLSARGNRRDLVRFYLHVLQSIG